VSVRQFPDDGEVDQWLFSYAPDGTDASPVLDQLDAATADSLNRFRANAPGLVTAGPADRYSRFPTQTGPRSAARYGS
jgi:hypothetical protein